MRRNKKWIWGILSAIGMLLLIFDTYTAINGAKEGLAVCIEVLIPSLFPFIFLTGIITSTFVGSNASFLHPFMKLLGIPKGSEVIFLLGIIGGYPIGAQAIYDAFKAGHIKKQTAKRMLGFCSNAGPAFIFGIASQMFRAPYMAWITWMIHIASAILTGVVLPGKTEEICKINATSSVSLTALLNNSIRTMAAICSWVIVFRIIIEYVNCWISGMVPTVIAILISGLLELSNGCIALTELDAERWKIILCSGFLSSGGLCIWMQTKSVTKELGTGSYIPGKILQAMISVILATFVQYFLSHPSAF